MENLVNGLEICKRVYLGDTHEEEFSRRNAEGLLTFIQCGFCWSLLVEREVIYGSARSHLADLMTKQV